MTEKREKGARVGSTWASQAFGETGPLPTRTHPTQPTKGILSRCRMPRSPSTSEKALVRFGVGWGGVGSTAGFLSTPGGGEGGWAVSASGPP